MALSYSNKVFNSTFFLTSRHQDLYKLITRLLASLFDTDSNGLATFTAGLDLATLAICAMASLVKYDTGERGARSKKA